MWGCGRFSIGLPKLSRNQQQADFQSAAGCHPAPHREESSRRAKDQRFSGADDRLSSSAAYPDSQATTGKENATRPRGDMDLTYASNRSTPAVINSGLAQR